MLFVHAGRPVELRHRRMHAQLHDDCASSETRTLPAVALHPRHDNTAQSFPSLTFSLLTNTLPGPRASEVTTIWRHTNLFIIIIIIITQSLVDPFKHGKKGGPYSITERGVPELIPVLGSQPAGDT